MVSLDFYLVAFIYVFLVMTKMAASDSGSDDVRVTSSSTTSTSASSTTGCFITISRASVCSTRGEDETRQNDVVTTSQEEHDVTMTSNYDVQTTSHPSDEDFTSGASCELATPRKSEMDWRFRWPFPQSHSYLNLTLDEYSIVVGGYFVVLDSRCDDGLRWNVTVVGRSQRKTFNILSSRGNSPVEGATTFWFNFEKSEEAKEVYVAFAGRQREATKQQGQQGRQQDPNYCGFVVDLELLHPCDAPAGVVSNDTTKDGSTSEDGTVEHGTPSQNPSPKTPSPESIVSKRTTPTIMSSTETTLIGSTESQKPQNFRGSFRIRNEEFLPNLGQETTEEFKSLYSKIYPLLNTSYSSTCGSVYRGIHKIAFRSGSIVVDNWFEVTGNFDDQIRNKSSTFIIDEFGRNGMDVDPKSFEFEPDSSGNAKNGPAEDNNWLLIVVVSTVLGVLIIVLVVIASLLIWRKTRQRDPEDEDETERQRAAQETRTCDAISGMPRSQLMWQNMPSLKAGFDDQSLFVYELPTQTPAKAHLAPTHKPPSASSSSFSSSSTSSSSSAPKNFLNYSYSESKHDPRFYIPRPSAIAEPTHASFSGFSPRGWGKTPRGWENPQHGGVETSQGQVWGQLPLDYNSVTHDYFVSGGPSRISAEPAEKRNSVRPQSTRPWSRTMKFSQRKSGSAPDAVDFGDVFLPSAPPFQLSDVLRCHELPPGEVERSGKTTRSTSVGCGAGGRRGVESGEGTMEGVNNNSFCGENGQQNGVELMEGRCSTSRCCSQSAERMTSPTQSPHASGSITNSQVNLLSSVYTRSPKKKQSSQTPDNIHRSTMLTLADDAFFQNINSTSEL